MGVFFIDFFLFQKYIIIIKRGKNNRYIRELKELDNTLTKDPLLLVKSDIFRLPIDEFIEEFLSLKYISPSMIPITLPTE